MYLPCSVMLVDVQVSESDFSQLVKNSRPVPMGVQPVQRNRAPNLEGPQIQDQQPIRSINILVCVIGSN